MNKEIDKKKKERKEQMNKSISRFRNKKINVQTYKFNK